MLMHKKVGDEKPQAQSYFHTGEGIETFVKVSEEHLADIRNRFIRWALTRVSVYPKEIVDAGCGLGDSLIILRALFPDAKLIGIDVSTEMISKAAARVDANIELIAQDVSEKTSKQLDPDLVLVFSSLRLWRDPGKGLSLLLETLKAGGTLCVFDLLRADSDAPLKMFSRGTAFLSPVERAFVSDQRMAAQSLSEVRSILPTLKCKHKRLIIGVEVVRQLYPEMLGPQKQLASADDGYYMLVLTK